MKKFLALLLSLVLVMSSIPAAFAVDANTALSLSVVADLEDPEVCPGDKIDFTLYLNGADTVGGIYGLEFWLTIPEGLTLVSGSVKKHADNTLTGDPIVGTGVLKFMLYTPTYGEGSTPITAANATVITFSCTVDEDVTSAMVFSVDDEAMLYGQETDYYLSKNDFAMESVELTIHEHDFGGGLNGMNYDWNATHHWMYCSGCEYTTERVLHDTVIIGQPSCTEQAMKYTMCSECGYQNIEYFEKIDHADENGDGYCDTCYEHMCDLLGHDWEIVDETDDEITFKCKLCGAEMTEEKNNNTVIDVRPDGTIVITTTNEDGTVTVETRKDGITTIVIYDANGNIISIEVTISKRVAIEAAKSGEAVDLSLLETLGLTAGDNLKVTINTNYDEPIAVEIPVANVTPGCVIVIVDAEGNETVVANTKMTENGLVFNCADGATIKVEDKSISFADIKGENWYNDAVDFVSARGIMTGMTATTFAQNGVTTRAQLWTMLARLSGVDTTCTEGNWYDVARAWAMENGISDGTDANGELTREMLVTMLYRFVGETGESKSIADFSDAANASDWAKAALEWAYGEGVMNGNADGTMNPAGETTRAQMAQFFMNFIQNI